MQRIINSVLCVLVILAMAISVAVAAPPATGRYIVVLHDRVASPAAAASEIAQQVGGRVGYIYEHALKGFSITLPPQAVATLGKNPNVKYVATDDIRYTSAQTIPTGIQRIFAVDNENIKIDGIDERVDVDVAVIDTGIDLDHPDLNVAGGVDCTVSSGGGPPWARSFYCSETEGTGGDDDHYHGTHVAGTIAAIDNGIGVVGVAPGARLWAVKVLDSGGSGYSSGIIAGIDWITAKGFIAVANMSLSGPGYNEAEYDAIQGAVNKGVAFAVAAGNDDDAASKYSPAAFNNVLTVSALADYDGEPGENYENYDTLASFSNWGIAVDIAAPGVSILSTFPLEYGGYGTISGTSMASPHVAGALALLASAKKPLSSADVFFLYDQIKIAGNFYWIDDSGDNIHEPLLDVSNSNVFAPDMVLGDGGGTHINVPPSVNISSPDNAAIFESGSNINFAGTGSDPEDGDLTDSLVWTSDSAGPIGTGGSFETTLVAGTHTITASVTDSAGVPGTDSITITVKAASDGGITLSVSAYKVRGAGRADLTWAGGDSDYIDIYRDGTKIDTTENSGAYHDESLGKGGGTATYQVCENGSTSMCSNLVTVSW